MLLGISRRRGRVEFDSSVTMESVQGGDADGADETTVPENGFEFSVEDVARANANAVGDASTSPTVAPNLGATGDDGKMNAMARVKLYRLNDRGHWDDKGTGFASCEYLEVRDLVKLKLARKTDETRSFANAQQSSSIGLVVMSEQNQEPLLVHRISQERNFYSRQECETIISWLDPELGADIALSFQEGVGCNFIWEQINSVQRSYSQQGAGAPGDNDDSKLMAMDTGSEFQVFQFEPERGGFLGVGDAQVYMRMGRNAQIEPLPEPELGNLEKLLILITSGSHFARERIPLQIMSSQDYLPRLFELFRQCEDVDDIESLHLFYAIFRGLVNLNDPNLYEILLREQNVFDFVGTLEYDPEQLERVHHRQFLKENVVFKEVVPINNKLIREKIHQTCRLGYLKDAILPRVLDDAAFSTLTTMMMCNNVEVVQALHDEPEFFAELFKRLNESKPGEEDWNDLVGFLQELCTLARHLQNQPRLQVFATLEKHGLYDVLTDILVHGDEYSQLKAADVLMSSLQNDPLVLRKFMVEQDAQKPEQNMFSQLVRMFLTGTDGIQATYLEILLFLTDPETMEGTQPEKDKLLEIFYDKHMESIVARITLGKVDIGDKDSAVGERVPAWSLTKIIDLMIFLVQNHAYRIKYFMLRNHVLQHVLQLTERREKYVVVSAVRFLRACVSLKDEFYNRYLIKSNAFEPVMRVFKRNGDRYNLLNSVVLELVDFIRRENIRGLIHHLVEKYESWFEEVYYVDTFRLLKLRYQQGMGPATIDLPAGMMLPGVGVSPRAYGREEIAAAQALSEQRARRDSSMSKDEEDYFESDDDPASDAVVEQMPHHSPPVLHFQGSRFVPPPLQHSVFTDEVDTGPTHGELGKHGRSMSPPPCGTDFLASGEACEQLKRSKPVIASPAEESLTAAQRNAFKAQTTQNVAEENSEETPEEKHPETDGDVKQTANPTSSWVTVDESSEKS